MKSLLALLLFLSLTVISTVAINKYFSKDAIQLKDIKVLTFQKGQWTTGKRSSPVQQLTCIGGTARSKSNSVENVQCTNSGFNGKTYDWKCESTLDKTLKLGQFAVSCEGYDNPDDDYVLVGSCGLEYNLEYTDHYYSQKKQPQPQVVVYPHTTLVNDTDIIAEVVVYVFMVFLIVVFVMAFLGYCCRCITNPQIRHPTYSSSYSSSYPSSVPTYSPPPVYTPQPQVVVDNSASSFAQGVVTGAVLTHRPVAPVTIVNPVVTTPYVPVAPYRPVTVINPVSTYVSPPVVHSTTIVQSPTLPPAKQDQGDTHTSVSYGTTRNR